MRRLMKMKSRAKNPSMILMIPTSLNTVTAIAAAMEKWWPAITRSVRGSGSIWDAQNSGLLLEKRRSGSVETAGPRGHRGLELQGEEGEEGGEVEVEAVVEGSRNTV